MSGDVTAAVEPSPEQAEAEARQRDESTQWKVFLGVGLFIAVIAVVYWFSSYEDAGTTMLAVASLLALFFGTFLWRQDRRRDVALAHGAGDDDTVDEGHYLPEASVWPLAMGVGAAMTLNGLIIGWPYATPGAAFLAIAVGGFVAQGRNRS